MILMLSLSLVLMWRDNRWSDTFGGITVTYTAVRLGCVLSSRIGEDLDRSLRRVSGPVVVHRDDWLGSELRFESGSVTCCRRW